MMLHRHFEAENSQNMTRLSDLQKEEEEFESEIFPPEAEQQKRRGRPKKTTD